MIALVPAAQRLADLLNHVPDARAVAAPTTWTVAATAAHVLAELQDHADLAEADTPPRLPDGPAWTRGRAANAQQLQKDPRRDLREIADELVPAAERAVRVLSGRTDRLWSTNALQWTGEQTLQVLLGEQLVHGRDIAAAAGLPWPISRTDALDVAQGSLGLLPDYLKPGGDPERHQRYAIKLRGGPAYRVVVEGDVATVGPVGDRVDCVISADPVAFVLVGYGRLSPLKAAATGRVVAYGRKPWLGLSFGTLLAAP